MILEDFHEGVSIEIPSSTVGSREVPLRRPEADAAVRRAGVADLVVAFSTEQLVLLEDPVNLLFPLG